MMVIFPIVKLLNEKYYTRNDYETLFEINSSYAVKYLRKKERNKLLELLSAYFLHVESFRQRVAAWMRSLLVWVADLKCIMGISYTEEELYAHVLVMEQIMSTGGGWQD